ncbi:MAG: N(4)-(beta-N-acetylglucosaminyl)-L-asparaginase [Chitinophagaceae bacterium]
MFHRRKFLQTTFLSSTALLLGKRSLSESPQAGVVPMIDQPVIITTWAQNKKANAAAWEVLGTGGRALDAVVKGVQVPEADPGDMSVGYGGMPDRDGKVTCDSCVMDEFDNCGAVMCLEHIVHAVLVARLVMEKTPHVQLVGAGALQFALEQGFEKVNMRTPQSEKAWKQWLKTNKYDPTTTDSLLRKADKNSLSVPGQQFNHDTIGMLALDAKGNLGGACTSSGMAFKMHGRVGDSPIIGAGLFVDNEVGAATSSGVGEEVVKIVGSHLVVELMRQNYNPEQACKKVIERMVRKRKEKLKDLQVGFIAVNNKGEFGGYALQKGFTYCVTTNQGTKIYEAKSWF